MSAHKVVILGAGAAGTAAARALAGAAPDAVTVDLFGRTGETPYNRTLVNKGVAVGLLSPEQAAIPGVTSIPDTATAVDTDTRTITFASGRTEPYDALIVATGSAPRVPEDSRPGVPGPDVPGWAEAAGAGLITTLHSVEDAVHVRDLLGRLDRHARVVISGAGLVAAETATLLRDRGHKVTLLARTPIPGVTVFGDDLARRLADIHQARLTTAFGRTLTQVRQTGDRLELQLDDDTTLAADLVIVAHGTVPTALAPWHDGLTVDAELRSTTPGSGHSVYAAGGVAIHDDPALGPWRIDHWSDAAAQGEHAARTLLADLGHGTPAGPYQPRALFTATVHGSMIAGVGLTGTPSATTQLTAISTDPTVVLHHHGTVPIGVLGLDAASAVFGWAPRLHIKTHLDADVAGDIDRSADTAVA